MKMNGAPFEIAARPWPFRQTESVVGTGSSTVSTAPLPGLRAHRQPFRRAAVVRSAASFDPAARGARRRSTSGGVSLERSVQHADGAPAIAAVAEGGHRPGWRPRRRHGHATRDADKPELTVGRDREGRISLLSLVPKPATAAGCCSPAAPGPLRRPTGKGRRPAGPELAEFKIDGGRIEFHRPACPAGPSTKRSRIRRLPAQVPAAGRRRRPSWISVSPPTPARAWSTRGSLGLRPQGGGAA